MSVYSKSDRESMVNKEMKLVYTENVIVGKDHKPDFGHSKLFLYQNIKFPKHCVYITIVEI